MDTLRIWMSPTEGGSHGSSHSGSSHESSHGGSHKGSSSGHQSVARGEKEGSNTNQPVSATELSHTLGGMDFPADKNALKRFAMEKNARQEVIEIIDRMPNKQYGSMSDVERHFSDTKQGNR